MAKARGSRSPFLGTFDTGHRALIHVPRLIETRMLVQANSGGGKSWAVRRLLEQTAGHVQQLVIDPEGEFATLRERFDYVIAAPHDADALAHPRTAGLLARRLLETGVSAILDIYDLPARERQVFVRTFCDTIMNAPKSLWHPVLIVLDEAHVYAPEKGKAESTDAVIDLATRGRKRGYCLVAATQRLAKLHKDVAAELLNKFVGRTGLDVDVKRAADELGMSQRDAMKQLRPLEPGTFYTFGPALSTTVQRLTVGPVVTTHPKAGHRLLRAPPKPTAAIKAVLPKLADLPKEAEAEARTIEALQRELASTRRELAKAKNTKPLVPSPSSKDVQAAQERGYEQGTADMRRAMLAEMMADKERIAGAVHKAIDVVFKSTPVTPGKYLHSRKAKATLTSVPASRHAVVKSAAPARSTPQPTQRIPIESTDMVSAPQQKLLDALLWLEERGLAPAPKKTLAAIAGVSPTSGGYYNNLGKLHNQFGLITYPDSGTVELTDTGRQLAHSTPDARPIHEHWLDIVTAPQKVILKALIEHHPREVEKSALATEIGVSPTSGGYFNNLGRLSTLGAISYPRRGYVALTEYVMPD